MSRSSFFICAGLFGLTASCNVYHSDFDCPPSCGVPCASLTEIESMIVETKEGPDVFPMGCPAPAPSWAQEIASCPKSQSQKIWITERENEKGCLIEGHYIYLPEPTGGK